MVAGFIGTVTVAPTASASVTPILSGASWLGGSGVNVCGSSTDPSCGGQAHVGGWSANWWQCVELAQRLYKSRGWYGGIFSGVNYAYQIYDQAPSLGMTRQGNGSITSIVPGDMIIHGADTPYSGGAGHVSIVDSVVGTTVNAVEQNSINGQPRATYSFSNGALVRTGTGTIRGAVHVPGNTNLAGGSTTAPRYADVNRDGFGDVPILHQTGVDSAAVHVLYGSTGTPFQYNPTLVRNLPSAVGWAWSKMKTASGDFNGDGYSDVVIVHQLADDGADVHVFYGSVEVPLQNSTTFVRHLLASDGWRWSKMKLASGDFNGDGLSDVAVVHQLADDGADVHVLYGGTSAPFSYSSTIARHLLATDGWAWSKMKLVTGKFNADGYSDLAILHQLGDGGFDVHVLYGSAGTPFQYNPTFARRLAASDGWDWSKVKMSSGDFNGDGFDDVAVVHQVIGDGADVHILYGSVGTPFQYSPTIARHLLATDGWAWSKMRLATTS